ncbi:MAG: DUF1631 family protein [Burkholderiales bacterium]
MASRALLALARDLARNRLVDALAAAVVKADDDLFRAADRAGTGGEQQKLLDAMIHLRNARKAIPSGFALAFVEVFELRINSRAEEALAMTRPMLLADLSIIETNAMEDGLAVTELARGAKNAIEPDAMHALRVRVGFLMGEDPLDDRRNPVAPEAIYEALRRATSGIPGEPPVRRAILAILQPYVNAAITPIYNEINQLLVERGIVPVIKRELERSHGSMSATQAMRLGNLPSPPTGGGGGTGAGGESRGNAAGNVTQALNLANLMTGLSGRPGHPLASAPTAAAPTPMEDLAAALGKALDSPAPARRAIVRMLAEPARYDFQEAIDTPASPGLVHSLTRLQAGPVTAGSSEAFLAGIDPAIRSQAHPLDLLTVEFVSIVFEHILNDRSIPETVKSVIARLQIVAVKAAILDRTFFAKREHPVRAILDQIATAALDPEIDCAESGPFIARLREIVGEVITQFNEDLAVFTAAGAQIQTLVAAIATERQSELNSSARALEEKERAEIAHATALAEVRRRVTGPTPLYVREFMNGWWTRALSAAYLHELAGDDSWTHRLGVVDALVWSVGPLSRNEIGQLATMLPLLMRNLQRGMAAIHMPEPARRAFFDELMKTHTSTIEGVKSLSRSQPVQVLLSGGADGVAQSASIDSHAVPPEVLPGDPILDYFDHAVSALDRGTVLEFTEDQTTVRAKLTWISPKRTILAFTSNIGAARQLSPSALAQALRSGLASIPEASEALMDRVVRSVVGEATAG